MFDATEEAKKIQNEIIEWRRYIHKHAELGFQLKNTVEFVCQKLSEFGVDHERFGDYGVLATIKGSESGKTIALRADMDALPASEETEIDFKSVNIGNAHLCGHDTHTAMLLGAAKILNEQKNNITGTVKFIFQPAEELALGAATMIRDHHVLDGVDAIFGMHVTTPDPSGYLIYTIGPAMASSGKFDIVIKGKGAHGAMPHFSNDPIIIAAQFITAVQTIVSRNIDPTDAAVVTIGKITGGTTFNIIPDNVEISGTFRAVRNETTHKLKSRIEEILDGICRSYNAEYDANIEVVTPALENPQELTQFAINSASKIVGDHIINNPVPIMAGEDFAYYMQQVPGCFISIGAGSEDEGYAYPVHNSKVKFNEDIFWIGSATFVQVTLDFLHTDEKFNK